MWDAGLQLIKVSLRGVSLKAPRATHVINTIVEKFGASLDSEFNN